LTSEQHATYIQCRLDARYKHLLLDEFQDTNPLQWSIVRAWLDAYGADVERPSIFIVGDPKQSIYRFRRADPRVFDAASRLLQSQGAFLLRTNKTRRNDRAIVDVLNTSMAENRLYAPQTTLKQSEGAVWRLPLVDMVRNAEEEKDGEKGVETEDDKELPVTRIRNPLTTPAEEVEDTRRLEEGREIAQALLKLRGEATAQGEPLPWSDVMMLVRRRTHLSAYETALREAGIPFISSRRGGLLDALEVTDLIALLTFLITPDDNLALAHVLKSPLFSATDDDLIDLAQRDETTWWKRLSVFQNDRSELKRAKTLLSDWMEAAHYLPAHDLLDRIIHQSELVQRYAQHAGFANRNQVVGNISAFIELALNMDAGRYPSLPKFIDMLRELQVSAEGDSPDESAVENNADAIRILTIHSAKGLEARLVVLVDANHTEGLNDTLGILTEWPLGDTSNQQSQSMHFSAYGRKDQRGFARDSLFQQEEMLAAQENWNLLYVAVTRAKQWLLLSGVAKNKTPIASGSWYDRLQHVPILSMPHNEEGNSHRVSMEFELSIFLPPDLSLPVGFAESPVSVNTPEQTEGTALHSLMERVTAQPCSWPIELPEATHIAMWLPCPVDLAKAIRVQAQAILQNSALERFFNSAHFRFARNEMEVICENQLLRLDRVVVFDNEVWVLDFKRQLLEQERADYQAQLEKYCSALRPIYQHHHIHAGLILSDGSFLELQALI